MRAPGAALRVRDAQEGVDRGLEVDGRLAAGQLDGIAAVGDVEEEDRGAALLAQQADGGAIVLVVNVVGRHGDKGAVPAGGGLGCRWRGAWCLRHGWAATTAARSILGTLCLRMRSKHEEWTPLAASC